MNTVRHILTHFWTSAGGIIIAGIQVYVASSPAGKYAALATAVLGLIAKDPNKH